MFKIDLTLYSDRIILNNTRPITYDPNSDQTDILTASNYYYI